MKIQLLDGREMELRTWFRNIFIDATSFNFKEDKDIVVMTAGLRELTLSTLNTIVETIKLNDIKLDGSKVQIRAGNTDSFTFWMLLQKEIS